MPSVNEIEKSAFSYCSGLTSIDLSSCTELDIESLAFHGCIHAEVRLPTSVSRISRYAFGYGQEAQCAKVKIKGGSEYNRIYALVTGYPCHYPAALIEQY